MSQASVSVTGALYARIKAAARERGVSITAFVEEALWREGAPRVIGAPLSPTVAIPVSAGIQELIGDHVVRHGGSAARVFELAVMRALDAAEAGRPVPW